MTYRSSLKISDAHDANSRPEAHVPVQVHEIDACVFRLLSSVMLGFFYTNARYDDTPFIIPMRGTMKGMTVTHAHLYPLLLVFRYSP